MIDAASERMARNVLVVNEAIERAGQNRHALTVQEGQQWTSRIGHETWSGLSIPITRGRYSSHAGIADISLSP